MQVGRVGDDEMGRLLIDHLRGEAQPFARCLHTERLLVDPESSTGVAVQLVTSQVRCFRPTAWRSQVV